VRASPCSSSRARLIALVLLAASAAACATVRPEQRERLADPSMSFESANMAGRHEQHVIENREGSSGGGNARGGGCGCN
jgi:hypothetical protein